MYDFIIVGAGSAGCVLANRLSADPGARVLLLEAGGRDRTPYIHMPAGLVNLADTKYDWAFRTVPQLHMNGRQMYWPRGKTLGGSSSINAMVYIRGHRRDYDGWEAEGNPGWGYESVLPVFRAAENNARGTDAFHGAGGPLDVADHIYRNPLTDVFVRAGQEVGLPLNTDFNGAVQEGVGYFQVTQRNGRRCSAAVAYLRPAAQRANLSVVTNAHAARVLIRGRQAIGVEYARGRRRETVYTDGEVILAAGAINSPQLLLLSGVGPADELRQAGVATVHDLPGVGKNLQDHLNANVICECTQPITYDGLDRPLPSIRHGLRFLLQRDGPITSNIAEAGGFVRSGPSASYPDVQFHFIPAYVIDHARIRPRGHGLTLHACCLNPESRGEIRLANADPLSAPAIDPCYLSRPADLEVIVRGIRRAREIFAAPAFRPYVGTEKYPGADVETDRDLAEFVRGYAETEYHPVGTCRMGNDPMAVVDSELRVHGIEGLRVADAAIMPTLVSGNTNAPSIMIGEMAARFALGERPAHMVAEQTRAAGEAR